MTDHEADRPWTVGFNAGWAEAEASSADEIATLHQEATQQAARIKRLEAENEKLAAALDTFRGRYRLYCGWPHLEWAGETDKKLLAMADEVLGALQEAGQ